MNILKIPLPGEDIQKRKRERQTEGGGRKKEKMGGKKEQKGINNF